eukprot:518050-Pleurochrysis_carterae.AAC.1
MKQAKWAPGYAWYMLIVGGGARPTLIMRLKVFRRYLKRRGKPRYLISRSRSLLLSLATIIAASGRGDYGRTSV